MRCLHVVVVSLPLVLASLETGVVAVILVALIALAGLITLLLAALFVETVRAALTPCVACMTRQWARVRVLDPVGVSVVVVVPVTVVATVVVAVTIVVAITITVAGTLTITVVRLVVVAVVATAVTLPLVATVTVAVVVVAVALTLVPWDKGILDGLPVHVGSNLLNSGVVHREIGVFKVIPPRPWHG